MLWRLVLPEVRTIDHRFLDQSYEVGGRFVDPLAGTITWNGKVENVRRKQLEVLALLASANGECVPRLQFLSEIWGDNALVGERGLNDTIFALRKSLRDEETSHPLIRTIPRRGYQLSAKLGLQTESRSQQWIPGTAIPGKSGWRLLRLLGESEFSSTWLAELSSQSSLCVVRFSQSEQHLRQVQREVTLLRYLREALARSQRVVRIIDWRLADPPYYVAMDYVTGGSLASWTHSNPSWIKLTQEQRLQLALDLAEGLAAVHAALVVHQNLNPDALLIEPTGAGPRGKLCGFGRGKLGDQQRLNSLAITAAGLDGPSIETPAHSDYVAPEVGQGAISSFESDIYAVGVLIAKIMVADLAAAPHQSLIKIEQQDLNAVIARCLGEASGRPSALTLSQELRQLVYGKQAALTSESPRPIGEAESRAAADESLHIASTDAMSSFDGRYRLLERLGEGGMGQVYLAEQREPVRRQVALKIGRDGPDESLLQATFERERQAFACMRHPNIPAVFDAGVTANGRPFIAMELAGRCDLVTHCDQGALKISERVRLFCQVCDAIEHAHQHGLIHRDIKPANLLVQSHEGRAAQVKVIDFGVAKSFQSLPEELAVELRLGATVGTPLYCSPEQLGSQSDAVDTRSDIYSLGVVLFELLVGVTPYTPEAIASLLRRGDASQLQSTPPLVGMTERLRQIGELRQRELARLRGLVPRQHRQCLSGDLESIVECCMNGLPQGRYATVTELRQDLENWLDHRAITTNIGSVGSWLSRLRRRHRVGMPVVATVALASIVLMAVLTREYIKTGSAFAAAQKGLAEAHAVAQFRVAQVQSLDPTQIGLDLRDDMSVALEQALPATEGVDAIRPAGTATPAEVVDHLLNQVNFSEIALNQIDRNYLRPMADRAEAELSGSPEMQAKVWQSVGDMLLALDRPESASVVLERALQSRMSLFGESEAQTLETLRSLALCELALGRTTDAISKLERAYRGHLAAIGAEHLYTLRSQEAWAKGLLATGKTEDALDLYQSALQARRKVFGVNAASTLDAELAYASALFEAKRFDEAKQSLNALREKVNAVPDTQQPLRVRVLKELAQLLIVRSSDAKAEEATRVAYRAALDLYGPRHSISLALSNELANLLRFRGELVEAERLHRENLKLRTQTLGARHPETWRSMSNLGLTLLDMGQWDSAAPFLLESETETRRILGDQNVQWLSARRRVGLLNLEQGRLDEARSIFLELLEIRSKLFGKDDWRTIRAQSDIAEIYRRQGDLLAAVRLQRQVVGSFRAIDFAADPIANVQLCDLGRLLTEAGSYEESDRVLQQCLSGLVAFEGANHPYALQALHAYTDNLLAMGRTEEAIVSGRELVATAKAALVPEDPRLGMMLFSVGTALSKGGHQEDALTYFNDAWNALLRAGQAGQQIQIRHLADFRAVLSWLQSPAARSVDASQKKIWRDRVKHLSTATMSQGIALVD